MKNSSTIIEQNFELRNQISEYSKKNLESRKEIISLERENAELKQVIKNLNLKLTLANRRIKQLEEKHEKYILEEANRIEEIVNKAIAKVTKELNKKHEEEVKNLNNKISRLEKRLNIDSSNSGIPTSKDPIGKHKIQNNREKSEKKIGAQEGHSIKKLEYFKDEEITKTVEHTLDNCPKCGGKLEELNIVKSDIIDIEINVTKTRNNIHNYKCLCCNKKISGNDSLPRGVTYGENINAMALSMMNESNNALNKITSFFKGITNNEVNLCEGYLIKLQKKSADNLKLFSYDLKEKIITLKNLFWDDTTVKFGIGKPSEGYDEDDIEYQKKLVNNTDKKDKKIRNGIIRFYGNDYWALLIGHKYKNSDGIDNDGILENLSKECVVMHDHVLLNYNNKYNFKNAECNEHTLRYLKGNIDMFPEHEWAKNMRNLLVQVNNDKKISLSNKEISFTDKYLNLISSKYDEFIKLGYSENNTVDLTYIQNKIDELNLIERLEKFKENHLMFAYDFSVDFTNNTSERGLRQVKRKLAVSFMFKNANRMKDYATIISYLETCSRNGISRFQASKRLVSGNPYNIKEIESIQKKED